MECGHSLAYDYTKLDKELAVSLLMHKFNDGPTLPFGVIGVTSPVFLFVGEQANQETLDLPWVSLTGSSHYLYTCLQDAGYLEQEIAFVNAFDLQGKPVNLRVVEDVTMPRVVIALGSKAGREARRMLARTTMAHGMPFHEVAHPAYWKRFQSKHRQQYVDELRRIRVGHYNANRLGNREVPRSLGPTT
jgi:hypothetical protein